MIHGITSALHRFVILRSVKLARAFFSAPVATKDLAVESLGLKNASLPSSRWQILVTQLVCAQIGRHRSLSAHSAQLPDRKRQRQKRQPCAQMLQGVSAGNLAKSVDWLVKQFK